MMYIMIGVGLYYDLHVQGLFSVIFHICPSNISLQFDTTMMYIMMVLVFIKIFQLRHPDTAYPAFSTMYIFGFALALEVRQKANF